MRRVYWVSVSLAAIALLVLAAASDSNYGWAASCACCQQCNTCAAPFCCWQPGCCETPPSPCDNAWAGYCQEKARRNARRYRLGTGGTCCYGAAVVSYQVLPVASHTAMRTARTTTADSSEVLLPAEQADLSDPAPLPRPRD
jgi:hypothetical protein